MLCITACLLQYRLLRVHQDLGFSGMRQFLWPLSLCIAFGCCSVCHCLRHRPTNLFDHLCLERIRLSNTVTARAFYPLHLAVSHKVGIYFHKKSTRSGCFDVSDTLAGIIFIHPVCSTMPHSLSKSMRLSRC